MVTSKPANNVPFTSPIIALQTLRNAIVHNKGWLKTKNSTLRRHFKNGLIDVKHQEEEMRNELSGRIGVTPEYIDFVLPQIRKFFQDIKV